MLPIDSPHWLTRAVLLVMLVAGGCASKPTLDEGAAERTQAHQSVDEILSRPMAAEEYGGTPRRCISKYAYHDFQPLGDAYVLFKGSGDKLWLNELRGRCPGLGHSSALAFDIRGNQLCELDRFKITDWFDWARYRRWPWDWLDGIPCTLGKFQPVNAEQVDAIRAALKEH